MSPFNSAVASLALVAGLLVLSACAGAGKQSPDPLRPTASAAADALGDHYAALEGAADSVVAAQSSDDAAPSELAQVTARNLGGRIRALSDDYGDLSLAMTAANYEQGVSLWMRLAFAQAALELLQEDADRLGDDPLTGPADVHDLADRLSGVLELGRVTGRVASRIFGAPPLAAPDPVGAVIPVAPGDCAACLRSLPPQS